MKMSIATKVLDGVIGLTCAAVLTAVILKSNIERAAAEKELKEVKAQLSQLKIENMVKDTQIDYLTRVK